MNAIILYSEMPRRSPSRQPAGDVADLGKIQVASKHLLGLINGILDLSKIEAGKMDLHREASTSAAMTDEADQHFGAVWCATTEPVERDLRADLQTMHADLTKTRQILFNLLSNAAK